MEAPGKPSHCNVGGFASTAVATATQALERIAGSAGMPRADLRDRLAEWQGGPNALLVDIAKDLDATLNDVPDGSLATDWAHLGREMATDLSVGPEKALATLGEVRQLVLRSANARASPGQAQAFSASNAGKTIEPLSATSTAAAATKPSPKTSRRMR